LVLGRFAGGGLLNGEMPLDEFRAAAVLDRLAEEMSKASAKLVTREQAAHGVIRVANANMEQALRLVSVERGYDPRRFTLVSFGGAGGLHAAALADALRIPKVLIPAYPGAFSALGVLLADVVKDYSRTMMITIEPSKSLPREIGRAFTTLERQAKNDLRSEGFSSEQIELTRTLAMRYRGQSFELEILADENAVANFHQSHRERYGHSDEQKAVETVSVRLRAVGVTDKPQLNREKNVRRSKAKPQREALSWLGEKRRKVAVFDRAELLPGTAVPAPSIVVEYGSTTLIPAGWRAKVDVGHNLILEATRR
jgi:N-methylhydantoinase A